MMQVVQEHKSLWRIKHMYKKDASDCDECMALWDELEKAKEDHVKKLEKVITKHLLEKK
ncbi:hypothetical protein HY249_00695 [Candidatus Azambacteria bacterium]|nr:hypothetical protein [Candidatus Azambacteria bacterium]